MVRSCIVFSLLSAAGLLVGPASAQDSAAPRFTARELYYAAADAPAQSSPAKSQPAKPAAKPIQAKNNSTPARPVEVATNNSTPPQRSSTTPAAPQGGQLPGGGRVVNASLTTAPAPSSGQALGLKYSILKEIGGDYVEVSPDTVFHAHDHIRFNVESNSPGYLYIVSLGSSGVWRPMFPTSGVDDGRNHIDGFHSYTMPPGSRITFDQLVGEEKVFIVLSREPEPDLEQVIYSLQGGAAKPASQPDAPYRADAARHTLIASASIDNNTVGRLRNAYARDLIVETITDQTPGDHKEKAVYVVNPTGSKDSRVVADLTLIHK